MRGLLLQQNPPPATDFSFFLMMGLVFLIFYFLVLRPQRKRQLEHEELLKAAEKGDEVVTSGGIHGKITGVTDDVLTVEIAAMKSGERVRIKVSRNRLDSVKKAKGGQES